MQPHLRSGALMASKALCCLVVFFVVCPALPVPSSSDSYNALARFLGVARLSLAKVPPQSKASTSKTLAAHKKKTYAAAWCLRLNKGGLRGLFRELSCQIQYRQSLVVLNHPMDRILWHKYLHLYKKVSTQPDTPEAISRWQALYVLGTQMYPMQNKWAENAALPVYEVNGHHKALPFWIKEALRRDVGPLLHFDTHSDMSMLLTPGRILRAVKDLKRNRNTKKSWHIIAHTVDDCAMPVTGAVLSGAYRKVVWARPAWAEGPGFLNELFFYGVYQPKASLEDLTKPTLFPRPQGEFYQLFYNMSGHPKKQEFSEVFDLWTPLNHKYQPNADHFSHITPFRFSAIQTDLEIDRYGQGKGALQVKKLMQAIPKGPFTLDLDLDYFASIDLSEGFLRSYSERSKWMPLRDFKRQKAILRKRMGNFRNLLLFLRSRGRLPSLITIADSTFMNFAYNKVAEGQLEYTPLEHSAFLRHHVRKILREVYGPDVEGRGKLKRSQTPMPNASLGGKRWANFTPHNNIAPGHPPLAPMTYTSHVRKGASTPAPKRPLFLPLQSKSIAPKYDF